MKKAIIIGAGFGGMAAAIRLRKKGYKVEIVDRCNNLGVILSIRKLSFETTVINLLEQRTPSK